jgi:hypothetical protein
LSIRLVGLVAVAIAAPSAFAQPQCGFTDRLFGARFERADQPAVQLAAPTTPLTISIDARYSGATTSQAAVAVFGTYAGPPLTGVSVNGRPGRRHGQTWLVDAVPLQAGPNTLTATATRLNDQSVQTTVTIHRAPPSPDQPEVAATNVQRYAPGRGAVSVALPPGSALQLQDVRLDVDGDGTPEQTLPGATDPVSVTVALDQPGLYLIRVSGDLDDTDPATAPIPFQRDLPVLVEHTGLSRLELCAVFHHMQSRLQAGNINGALQALHPRLHTRFRALWEGLGGTLPTVAAGLGEVADGTLGPEGAELLIARPDQESPGTLEGFPLRMAQGSDGVWRIQEM